MQNVINQLSSFSDKLDFSMDFCGGGGWWETDGMAAESRKRIFQIS
jgi:hypothetical protein